MKETRAEEKLVGAVRGFGFMFSGKTALDIGSSTGGFTDVALKGGAAKVVAVEKGTNQMRMELRNDKRVELHEKTDIFQFEPAEEFDVILADVSFVSLKKVLKHVQSWGKEYLVLLKPQFEAKSGQLEKGIVKNNKIRREIIQDFEKWLKENNFSIVNKQDSQVSGRFGNVERVYWLRPVC